MNKPSELEMKANYHLFKKGIKPMWEDPENVQVSDFPFLFLFFSFLFFFSFFFSFLLSSPSFHRVENGLWKSKTTKNSLTFSGLFPASPLFSPPLTPLSLFLSFSLSLFLSFSLFLLFSLFQGELEHWDDW